MAWSFLSASLIILVAIPTFAAALLMLLTDRLGVSGFFDPTVGGDPVAYQHLFWFTFHPEVYVLVIPAIGMMYEIIPRFSRKPIFSYSSGVFAFVLLAIVGFASWAHHMYATGMSFTEKTVFMVGTLAAVPASAMHVFNFLATMWGGRAKYASPMMWSVGGIALFFAAGAGGVVNSAMPLDFVTHDSYWVVGHFHLFVFGTIAFGSIAFLYYMFPYVTGRMYHEKLGQVHFVLTFIGAIMVFFTQHVLGLYGQPRRIYDYPPIPEWIAMNQIASIGAIIILIGMVIFLCNIIYSSGRGKLANMDDPFGLGGKYYYPHQQKNPHH
jgi:cytochrome c oxidase subunit 1